MKDQITIQKLNDSTLLDEVKNLVRREKEIVFEVIEYLKEIEIRKLHLARGFSSLFAFATDYLGYSEAEAHIRIQAARLIQALPEVADKIQSGELSLSVAATAQAHFRKENLRRIEKEQPKLSVQEKRAALELVTGESRREAEQNLNIHFAQQSRKTLSFPACLELEEKIERLMNLMAHKNFDRDLGRMVELLVNAELERYGKKLGMKDHQQIMDGQNANQNLKLDQHADQNQSKKPNALESNLEQSQGKTKLSNPLAALPSSDGNHPQRRYIPRKTRTLVWAKYKGECSYRDPLTGRKCHSKHGIQIDHQLAFSKGGDHRPDNLTLLCASHNSWKGDRQLWIGN